MRFLRDDSGSTAIEYALIVGFVVVVIIASLRTIGPLLVIKFQGAAAGFS